MDLVLLADLEEGGSIELATPLALILIASFAFVIPLLARRIKLPAVVIEIVFGLVVGPAVLGIVEASELIDFLAEFGLFLLMFLVGFEIDFGRLQRRGRSELVTAFGVVGLIFVAAFLGTGLLEVSGTDQRIFLSLLISAAALGLVVPILRSTERSGTPLGQMALLLTVLAEVIAIIGVVVHLVLVEQGLGWEVLKVPALFAVMGLLLVLTKRAAWWMPERFERLFDQRDPDELGIRAVLALLFIFVGLAEILGIEPILGAFLAGTLFALVFRDPGGLQRQLSGFSFGFFIPIFFISVGLNFPLEALRDPAVLGEAAALIGVAFAIKILPALVLRFRGFSFREALGIGVLLAGQLSAIIALADVGAGLGLISDGQRAGAILLVAVSALLTPVAFRALLPPLPRREAGTPSEAH